VALADLGVERILVISLVMFLVIFLVEAVVVAVGGVMSRRVPIYVITLNYH
jgi:hypothetical protein